MNVALLYHSLVPDWNHGNAQFLRGIAGTRAYPGLTGVAYEPTRRVVLARHTAAHRAGELGAHLREAM